jgi:hypothetical protein
VKGIGHFGLKPPKFGGHGWRLHGMFCFVLFCCMGRGLGLIGLGSISARSDAKYCIHGNWSSA